MTSVLGYVAAFTDISQRPDAQLMFNHGRHVGMYSGYLMLVQDLGQCTEMFVAYGANHMVGERKPRGARANGAVSRRAVVSPQASMQ